MVIKIFANMYFEDLFDKIRPLWKDVYNLENYIDLGYNDEISIDDIRNEWRRVENIINRDVKRKYNLWEKDFNYIIYQVLSDYAERKRKEGICEIYFDEIPIEMFEKKLRENYKINKNCPKILLKTCQNFQKIYKGFKNKKLSKKK